MDTTNSFSCGIAAWTTAQFTAAELTAIRRQPEGKVPRGLKIALLRHSDDQTVAALAAMRTAIDCWFPAVTDWSSWSVLASPRYPGRTGMAEGIRKYRREGPWTTSVQVIPHGSTHGMASTLSLALLCHGPCYGVGGSSDNDHDALLSALGGLPLTPNAAVWMIITGWDSEGLASANLSPGIPDQCRVLACALVAEDADIDCIGRLEFQPANHAAAAENTTDLLLAATDATSDELHISKNLNGWTAALTVNSRSARLIPFPQPAIRTDAAPSTRAA